MTVAPEALSKPGIHHVAYACRDINETVRFYDSLLGYPLVHTEIDHNPRGFLRHVFFDTGDGSCIAFFDLHGMGEKPDWKSAVSTGNGLPVWVNHIAFRADEARAAEVRARMDEAGVAPMMEIDHGWCHSVYYLDPNQILIELCRDTPGFEADPVKARELLVATERTDPPAKVTLHKGARNAPTP